MMINLRNSSWVIIWLLVFNSSVGMAAPNAKKNIIKHDEFSDPLLELQAEEEAKKAAEEEEALKVRGNTPLEENEPPPEPESAS
jgi:hypothetical protein